MTKQDVANMGPGMVFEIVHQKDPMGQTFGNTYNDDTFMVISSVQANSRMDTVVVAPVIEYDENNSFGVQFLVRRGGSTVTKTVCIDRMFKIMKKRLCKLRYVVSSDVMAKVNESIQRLFFGEPLYTKQEALAVAYREEMALRISILQKNSVSDDIIPLDGATYDSVNYVEAEDIKPKSREEEEEEFARKMLSAPDPVVMNVTSVESEEKAKPKPVIKKKSKSVFIVSSKNKDELKATPKKKEPVPANAEEKEKREYGRYAAIKEKWEDFLIDYTILSNSELMERYDIPNITTLYRLGKECKMIAVDHGMDIKEFRRNPNRIK